MRYGSLFFRSFYITFIGLFFMLFLSLTGVTVISAIHREALSMLTGFLMLTACAGISHRAVQYLLDG